MVGPSATWNTKRVFITYRNVLTRTLETGTWSAKSDVRITNTLSDGKRQVFRPGSLGSGDLNTIEGNSSLSVDLPIIDDPDNSPNGGVITLQINFTNGASEVFKLSPRLDWPEAGTDLSVFLDPSLVPAAPPVAIKGVPGGVAALDAQGYVIDAFGARVTGGGGTGDGTTTTWNTLYGRPAVVAAGDTQLAARLAIAVPSTAEVNQALDLKVNTSTYTTALAGKANLSQTGDPAALTTPVKTSIVAALNEVSGRTAQAGGTTPVTMESVQGLVAELDSKSDVGHKHTAADITGVQVYAAGSNVNFGTPNADGSIPINATSPGALPGDLTVQYGIMENPGGGYTIPPISQIANFAKVWKKWAGASTPPPEYCSDYDEWVRGGPISAPAFGVALQMGDSASSTQTWSWTLPTGITSGHLVHLNIWCYSNQTGEYTLTVGSGATARVIAGPTGSKLGSGFALRTYSFMADANTSGAPLVLTTAAPTASAVVFSAWGSTWDGISSSTPLAGPTFTTTPSTTATRTGPDLTTTAPSLFISGIAAQHATVVTSSWTVSAPLTVHSQFYRPTNTPRRSGASAAQPGISPAGLQPKPVWSSFDASAVASAPFNLAFAIAYPLKRGSLTNLRWDAGAWKLMAESV